MITWVWSMVSITVEPSAGAAFSCWVAIMPPAPPLLSTSTGWFSTSLSLSASTRAITSVAPPAGKPTRTFTWPR